MSDATWYYFLGMATGAAIMAAVCIHFFHRELDFLEEKAKEDVYDVWLDD